MTIRKFALGGAAAVAFAGLLGAAPVYAHTSQPATPEEIQQTDALNAQALANAQMGTKPNQPTAGVSSTTEVAPSTVTPDTSTTPDATPPNGDVPAKPVTVTPATPATATPAPATPAPVPPAPTQ